MAKKIEQFNILITGTGGQGLITLLQVISQAALSEGYDVKTSELHGLAQRGGSVQVHIRFGKKVFSPLISPGKTDLILGLEMQEVLKDSYFAGSKTNFLINKNIIPIPFEKKIAEDEIVKSIKKISKNVLLVPAADICKKELGTDVVSGIYLVSFASFKNLIPLKPESILRVIKKIIPEKYLELNLKTFKIAES